MHPFGRWAVPWVVREGSAALAGVRVCPQGHGGLCRQASVAALVVSVQVLLVEGSRARVTFLGAAGV